jgi:hypothetical protein
MVRQFLMLGLMAVVARGSEVIGPSHFYVVSEFFSDDGALFFYRVVEVTPDGMGSLVRYVRVAPSDLYCPRIMIQSAEVRVRDRSPSQLAGSNNPCAIKPGALRATLKRNSQKAGVFETISFGIVASRGSSSVSLAIPIAESVKLERLKATNSRIARLWDLESEITDAVFGKRTSSKTEAVRRIWRFKSGARD